MCDTELPQKRWGAIYESSITFANYRVEAPPVIEIGLEKDLADIVPILGQQLFFCAGKLAKQSHGGRGVIRRIGGRFSAGHF